eukprot:GHVP01052775.1.p1 GENE.GHVP01052775.1~~GHVP01052775.1.p1  ORF type:complete len:188 (+),score=37.15 GHVP01052775.1:638-1201(+)
MEDEMMRMTPDEIVFYSRREKICIEPYFDLNRIELIEGNYGPFIKNERIEITLWLAIELSKRNKCKIIIPNWLSINNLKIIINKEKHNDEFIHINFKYLEISNLIFKYYNINGNIEDKENNLKIDNNDNINEIIFLLKELKELRKEKILNGLYIIDKSGVLLNNISWMELNEIRDGIYEKCLLFNKL